MEAMSYLIAGYAVFIGITLVYVYSLVGRYKSLEKELRALASITDDQK